MGWLGLASAVPVVRYRMSTTTGFILKDGKVDPWLNARPVLGGEFAVEFMPTGRVPALQEYNNAALGVALSYYNLGNDEKLGQAFAPYVYLDIPFVRLSHFVLGIRPGIGIAFATKCYKNTVAEGHAYLDVKNANQSLGTYTNAYFAEALYVNFPIKKGFTITASFGWYHMSNGSMVQPNSGYNMFNGQLGLTYHPQISEYELPNLLVPRHLYDGKSWDVELSCSGGFRQAYYRDHTFFGVASVSVAAHWRPWSIFKIGAGVDAFYDGYYSSVSKEYATPDIQAPITLFQKTLLTSSVTANCFRVGISLQPEFVIGHFSAGFHFGLYLYDPIKNLEPYQSAREAGGSLKKGIFYSYDLLKAGSAGSPDGWLYTRILMKYRVTNHLFVQLGMKAHLTKVEFIDAGLGVAF